MRNTRSPYDRLLVVVLLAAISAGCARPDIEVHYGRRTGGRASLSVNGSAVLGQMFRQAGWRVESRFKLSPEVSRSADVILWMPDDFAPPGGPVTIWFERWLREAPNRTLIYVGRDFDAEPQYWEAVAGRLSGAERDRASERLAKARQRVQQGQAAFSPGTECDWFQLQSAAPRGPGRLSGPWADEISTGPHGLRIESQIVPVIPAAELLAVDGASLITRTSVGSTSSSLILIANGSFLLNVPLVEPVPRQLAALLIGACGPGADPRPRLAVFLESGPGGPTIIERDPPPGMTRSLDILTKWPWSYILVHLALVGIVYCFARLPIFGRPRELPPVSLADFGKHVTAVGDLLHKTGDRGYAHERLSQYRQIRG
jgi:hypothetical protein